MKVLQFFNYHWWSIIIISVTSNCLKWFSELLARRNHFSSYDYGGSWTDKPNLNHNIKIIIFSEQSSGHNWRQKSKKQFYE